MRLTKQTDYALVLMTHMASAGEREHIHAAPDLAARSRVPLPMVSKILKLLSRKELLVSHRGLNGGYSLAENPAQVTVADIIRAIEGPIALTDCSTGSDNECSFTSSCPSCNPLQRVNSAVNEALDGITLADVAAGHKQMIPHFGPTEAVAGA